MSDAPTLFSRIIAGDIPGQFVYQDDRCVAIRDIQPAAPTHILVIPIAEIPSVADVDASHEALLGHLLVVAARVAAQEGVAESGYRLIINHGADGGQTVPHLHIHILGGRPLGALVGGSGSHEETVPQ